jgi:hypothetical protein
MELKVITNPINGRGPARWLLSNLFYGCGYNFYRCEGELRADDLLIRGKLAHLLQECREHLRRLEAAFRREHRAPPGRDYAFLHPASVATAQTLLAAQRDLQGMEAAVHTAPLPQLARIRRRQREERGTLEKLVMLDGEMLLALVTLRDAVARLDDGAAAAAKVGSLLGASDFSALWRRREALLAGDTV